MFSSFSPEQIYIYFSVINESLYQHIIEIIPVSQEECNVYHMVAVTGSGVRLYFTTGFERGRPFKLQMMHIRLPPGYSPRSPHSRPSDVHTALYKKGNFALRKLIHMHNF